MKKLIAISISLVLFASAAFAQLTVGGTAGYGFTPISIEVEDDAKPMASSVSLWDRWGQAWVGRLEADYIGEGGVFGAHVRVNSHGSSDRTWAWWQPISQFKLVAGIDSNGQFGNNYIVGWGFHASDAEDYVAFNGYSKLTRDAAFYGGWGKLGAALLITPMDGLAINIGIPYGPDPDYPSKLAEEVYKRINAQVAYNISGIGEIGVTFIGGAGTVTQPASMGEQGSADAAAIQAQFYLTAVENLGINLGFKYTLSAEDAGTTVNTPIAVGLGASYAVSDAFGVKARLAATFAGSTEKEYPFVGKVKLEEGFKLGVDVMPYFDVGIVKIFVNLGMEFWADDSAEGTTSERAVPLSWYVNPYITKSVGSGTLYAGIQFGGAPNKTTKEDHIFFALPIGIQVAF